MPPRLALELYHLVIQHVRNKTDLCSLAVCCSAFQDEVQRCLFSDVEPKSLFQQKKFLLAINSAPLRLGSLVHSFCVEEWELGDDVRSVSLSTALHAMRNLKHLKLHWWKPSTILQGCTFQLRTFVNIYFLNRPEALFILCNFLPAQRGIKHVGIRREKLPGGLEVPTHLCPHLESVALHGKDLVHMLLPSDRRVTQFEWLAYRMPLPLTPNQLNGLKSLKFNIRTLGTDTSFSPHLTSLVKLELRVHRRDPDLIINNVSR